MSFLKPLLLLGLLGATVPILIHLIHRRKPRKQIFAALELVLRSVERVERRWRLKRFLLLLARVLLLAALSLAAAGPLIGPTRDLAVASSGPRRLAIVIDTSLSMRAAHDGGSSAFERAVMAAHNLVDAMGPEDQATLIAAGTKARLLVPRPTAARSELEQALDDLQPGFGTSEMGEAVTTAAQALVTLSDEGAPDGSRERQPKVQSRVVVLSDLAGHAFKTNADLSLGASSGSAASLEVVDVIADVKPRKRHNHAITRLDAISVPGNTARTIEFRARIQSFEQEQQGGSKSEGVPSDITLRSAGQDLLVGSVDVVEGTAVDKMLTHAFHEPGFISAEIALAPDALSQDDVRYVIADVRREVRVLIVDGAPSGVPKEDEIFYVERAFAAGAADQPAPRAITPDDLQHADLSAFDVVILAGVQSFLRSDGARLVDFVERGGGLFISVSEDLDFALYNSELTRVLPRLFRTLKILDAGGGGRVLGSTGVVTLAAPALEHPVLEIFRGDALQGLLSARTRGYALLEPDRTAKKANLLVAYEDGQPALLECEAGQGKVVVLTTTLDRDLSDLPIRPAFVPLLRRIVLYLGRALSVPDNRVTLVGDRRIVRGPKGTTKISVIAPTGEETVLEPSDLAVNPSDVAGSAPGVAFDGTLAPGQYRVKAATSHGSLEPLHSEDFAVNVDTHESDLRPLTLEEATAILRGTTRPTSSALSAETETESERAGWLSSIANPDGIVGALLLAMVMAFALESLLTARSGPG